MAAIAELNYELKVLDAQGRFALGNTSRRGWVPAIGNGQRQQVTLTGSSFTTISVPSGAKFAALVLGTAVSLTLKGVTGDTGVPLTPSGNPLGVDALFPLGSVSSFGIANGSGSSQTIEMFFL